MGILTDLVGQSVDKKNKDTAEQAALYATALLSPQASEQVHTHAVSKMLGLAGVKGKQALDLAPHLAKMLRVMHTQDGQKKDAAASGTAPTQAPAAQGAAPQPDDMAVGSGEPMPASLPATPQGPAAAAPPQQRRSLPSRIAHGLARVPGAVVDLPAHIAARGSNIQERANQENTTSRLAYIEARTDLTPQQKDALKMEALSASQAPIQSLGDEGRFGAEYKARTAAATQAQKDEIAQINALSIPPDEKTRMIEEVLTGLKSATPAAGATRALGKPVLGARFAGQKDVYGQPVDPKLYYDQLPAAPGQPARLFPAMPETPKLPGGDAGLITLANDPTAPPDVRKMAKDELAAKNRANTTRSDANEALADERRANKGGKLKKADIARAALSIVGGVNAPNATYDQKIDYAIANLKNPEFYKGDPMVEANREEILQGLYALKGKRPPAGRQGSSLVRNPKKAGAAGGSTGGSSGGAQPQKVATKAMIAAYAREHNVTEDQARAAARAANFKVE